MPAPTVITCPSCKKQLRVPPEAQGKKVRCKCGATIRVNAPAADKPSPAPTRPPAQAPAPAAKPPAAPPGDDEGGSYTFMSESTETTAIAQDSSSGNNDLTKQPQKFLKDEDDDNPYGITHLDDAYRCPFCAKEMDSPDAIICLHCGYNTQTRSIAQTRRVYAITFWDWCKWLGPGIACILVALATIAGDLYFCFGLQKAWWDPMDEGAGTKSFSNGIRVWVTVMALALTWVCLKFAFRRLVLNPKPPEVEKKK